MFSRKRFPDCQDRRRISEYPKYFFSDTGGYLREIPEHFFSDTGGYLREIPEDFDLEKAIKPLSRWWLIRRRILRFIFAVGK